MAKKDLVARTIRIKQAGEKTLNRELEPCCKRVRKAIQRLCAKRIIYCFRSSSAMNESVSPNALDEFVCAEGHTLGTLNFRGSSWWVDERVPRTVRDKDGKWVAYDEKESANQVKAK